jgi:hypothetical protein
MSEVFIFIFIWKARFVDTIITRFKVFKSNVKRVKKYRLDNNKNWLRINENNSRSRSFQLVNRLK